MQLFDKNANRADISQNQFKITDKYRSYNGSTGPLYDINIYNSVSIIVSMSK